LSSRFAAARIRPASRDWKVSTPHPLEWLLIEWPEEKEPTKYWLSNLPDPSLVVTRQLQFHHFDPVQVDSRWFFSIQELYGWRFHTLS
jgi:SRSO17 transposase